MAFSRCDYGIGEVGVGLPYPDGMRFGRLTDGRRLN